jgi:hypothetical protein
MYADWTGLVDHLLFPGIPLGARNVCSGLTLKWRCQIYCLHDDDVYGSRHVLAVAGLGAVASYGFVSNATYGTGLAVAWIAFVRQVGRSPLMAGQWKAFLAFYAGMLDCILKISQGPCQHDLNKPSTNALVHR